MTATFALICALLAALIAPVADGDFRAGGLKRETIHLAAAMTRTTRPAPASFVYPAGEDSAPAAIVVATHDGAFTGTASWFPARGYQGAVPWWKAGQQPVWATVSRFADGKTYSVAVLVTGFCACLAGQPGERLIDLSPAAFRALGVSLSVGLIRVQMTVPVQGPRLPATDTLEGE